MEVIYSGNVCIYLHGESAIVGNVDWNNSNSVMNGLLPSMWYISGKKNMVIHDYRKWNSLEEYVVPSYIKIYADEDWGEKYNYDEIECRVEIRDFDKSLPLETKILTFGSITDKKLPVHALYFTKIGISECNPDWIGYVELIEVDDDVVRRDFPNILVGEK